MRSRVPLLLLTASALGSSLGCGGDKPSGASGSAAASVSAKGSAAPNGSTATSEPDPSPLAIVVTSSIPIVLSKLEGGVWISDQVGKHMAIALDGKDIEERPAPTGLPDDLKRVQYVGGRAPATVWMSAATPPAEGKKVDTNPFYMLQSKANAWKPITDDWQPLVVPWSKKRVLAMSTSSGKLKIKTLVPYSKTPLADQPSMKVPDAECAKSLKLTEAITVSDNFVLGVGRCKLGETKQPTYVALQWIKESEQLTETQPDPREGSAPPTPTAEPTSLLVPEAPSAASPDAESDVGVRMTITPITTDRSQHRAIAAAAGVAYVASATESGESRLFELTAGDIPGAVELPKLEGPLLDVAATPNGDLYVVTKSAVWKRVQKEWTSMPAPRGVELEHADAAGDVVWIAGARGAEGILMRLGDGSATLKW